MGSRAAWSGATPPRSSGGSYFTKDSRGRPSGKLIAGAEVRETPTRVRARCALEPTVALEEERSVDKEAATENVTELVPPQQNARGRPD